VAVWVLVGVRVSVRVRDAVRVLVVVLVNEGVIVADGVLDSVGTGVTMAATGVGIYIQSRLLMMMMLIWNTRNNPTPTARHILHHRLPHGIYCSGR
jgi:hypothetical protein